MLCLNLVGANLSCGGLVSYHEEQGESVRGLSDGGTNIALVSGGASSLDDGLSGGGGNGGSGGSGNGGSGNGGSPEPSFGGASSGQECLDQELAPDIVFALERGSDAEGKFDPLSLTSVSINSGGMKGIECLSNLETVALVVEEGQESELPLLARLPHLVSLTVTAAPDLEFLRALPKLEVLDLDVGIDVDLTPVGELSELRKLLLADYTITSPEPLARLKKLERVVFFSVDSTGSMAWDSSFMKGWSLEELILIYSDIQLNFGDLDTTRLAELRLFGPSLNQLELLGPPAEGRGDVYMARDYSAGELPLPILCEKGWQLWEQPTWCAPEQDDLCSPLVEK